MIAVTTIVALRQDYNQIVKAIAQRALDGDILVPSVGRAELQALARKLEREYLERLVNHANDHQLEDQHQSPGNHHNEYDQARRRPILESVGQTSPDVSGVRRNIFLPRGNFLHAVVRLDNGCHEYREFLHRVSRNEGSRLPFVHGKHSLEQPLRRECNLSRLPCSAQVVRQSRQESAGEQLLAEREQFLREVVANDLKAYQIETVRYDEGQPTC